MNLSLDRLTLFITPALKATRQPGNRQPGNPSLLPIGIVRGWVLVRILHHVTYSAQLVRRFFFFFWFKMNREKYIETTTRMPPDEGAWLLRFGQLE